MGEYDTADNRCDDCGQWYGDIGLHKVNCKGKSEPQTIAAEYWLGYARGCLLRSKKEADPKEKLNLVLQVFVHLRRAQHLIDTGDRTDV